MAPYDAEVGGAATVSDPGADVKHQPPPYHVAAAYSKRAAEFHGPAYATPAAVGHEADRPPEASPSPLLPEATPETPPPPLVPPPTTPALVTSASLLSLDKVSLASFFNWVSVCLIFLVSS